MAIARPAGRERTTGRLADAAGEGLEAGLGGQGVDEAEYEGELSSPSSLTWGHTIWVDFYNWNSGRGLVSYIGTGQSEGPPSAPTW